MPLSFGCGLPSTENPCGLSASSLRPAESNVNHAPASWPAQSWIQRSFAVSEVAENAVPAQAGSLRDV
jgi:hypothetical protein